MKKVWLILLILLISGCARQIKLDVSTITKMEYDGLEIISDDYLKITDYLGKINFIETKYDATYNHDFIITTNDKLYSFSISEDYRIKYSTDDQTYYSKDIQDIKNLLMHLKGLDLTYRSDNFFQIDDVTEYVTNENDLFIKIDSTLNYFVLTSELDITNLKINRIEYVDEKFEDVDLLYKEEIIPANKKTVIRVTYPDATPNIRISFETKYNFVVSIIPTYDGKDGGFNYLVTMEQK